MDIVIHSKGSQPIGFLAQDEVEYAEIICKIIRMQPDERDRIRQAARFPALLPSFNCYFRLDLHCFLLCLYRDSVGRFSDSNFEQEFLKVMSSLMDISS